MKKILFMAVALILMSGCGTYNQTVQIDDNAYLLLIGNPYGSVVTIDDGSPIDLSRETTSFSLNGKKATKIKISTGRHTLQILKNGKLTVNRQFYVSTGSSFEVNL